MLSYICPSTEHWSPEMTTINYPKQDGQQLPPEVLAQRASLPTGNVQPVTDLDKHRVGINQLLEGIRHYLLAVEQDNDPTAVHRPVLSMQGVPDARLGAIIDKIGCGQLLIQFQALPDEMLDTIAEGRKMAEQVLKDARPTQDINPNEDFFDPPGT